MKKSLGYRILRLIIQYVREVSYLNRRYIILVFEKIKENRLEKKLNVQTDESCFFEDKFSLNKDGHGYQPTPYYVLEEIVDYLKLKPEDKFIDFGCGKGRALFFVSLQRLKKVIGIESSNELIDIARRNLNNFRLNKTPIELIHQDASKFKIMEGNIFFLFNPFGPQTLQAVINNIKESLDANPRSIRIAYYSPAYRNILDSQDWLVMEKEIKNCCCLFWHNKF